MKRSLALFLALAVVAVASGQAPYCPSGVTGVTCGGADEWISSVNFSSISQAGACVAAPAYQDFTAVTAPNLNQGVPVAITVVVGNYFSGDNVDAYFDWNGNNVLNDAGEHVVLTDSSGTFNGTVTPPLGAVATTRMRVTLAYFGLQDPCMAGEYYGGVWDFTVNTFSGPIPCTTAFSSPGGPGTVQIDNIPCPGLAGAAYFWAFTLAAGTYPAGNWYGLDIGLVQLLNWYNSGYPFIGTLDGAGASTYSAGGLPSGLQIWEVTTMWAPGYGSFLLAYPATTYTIP